MTAVFDRKVFFESVRNSLFGGALKQRQVDGMEALLSAWEAAPISDDLRYFAYMLATTFHETARTMQPIEEIGKGKGHSYGKPDPETGQTYYGRGFVQLTWKANYEEATSRLGLTGDDDLVWHPVKALDPKISAEVMFQGMTQGWFTGKKLKNYFSSHINDPIAARAIINADVSKNGKRIAGYHADFLAALQAAASAAEPIPPTEVNTVHLNIQASPGVSVSVALNGVILVG
jgi:putative chitinase